jgi:hypothetical protein
VAENALAAVMPSILVSLTMWIQARASSRLVTQVLVRVMEMALDVWRFGESGKTIVTVGVFFCVADPSLTCGENGKTFATDKLLVQIPVMFSE